jgi:hypothetical protein
VKDDYLAFLESQFEPQSIFEFDLGMCLSALKSIVDEPEQWDWEEIEWFLCKTEDLLEKFNAKYPDWMDEYARRKQEE